MKFDAQPIRKDNSDTQQCLHAGEKQYLISAIVSVYNCERFIEGCLEDLENQTIADKVEIVIVNSGSQQNEELIIKRFQDRYTNIVYLKTQERETIYKAWNRAIKVSTGKYITNANSDDRHRKDAFEIMSNALETNPGIDVVYPDYIFTETENETFENCTPVLFYKSKDYDRMDLLWSSLPSHQPMWRKRLHEEFAYFDENYEVAGDREFWLRISGKCCFMHIKEYLGLYLQRRDSAERRNNIVTVEEISRVVNRYIDESFIRSITHGNELIKNIRKRQSLVAFYHGDYFYSKGLISLAIKYLCQSLKYDWQNFKSFRLLAVCFLPQKLSRLLFALNNKFKTFCRLRT